MEKSMAKKSSPGIDVSNNEIKANGNVNIGSTFNSGVDQPSQNQAVTVTVQNEQKTHVQQDQTVELTVFVDILKDSLTVKQFEEIQKILKSDQPKEEMKKSLAEKLESFGVNVLTSLATGLITNLGSAMLG